jgi:hypothetical protein
MVFQTDGNFVGYNNPGTTHWFNAATANRGDKLALQPDCNVVVYDINNVALWNAHSGSGGLNWDFCDIALSGNNYAYVTIYPPGHQSFISAYIP